MAEAGLGSGESAVLGHGFLDDFVERRRIKDLPPVSGDGVAAVELLGLTAGSDGLSRLRVLGVLGHRGRLGAGEIGADGAGGEEQGEDEAEGKAVKNPP